MRLLYICQQFKKLIFSKISELKTSGKKAAICSFRLLTKKQTPQYIILAKILNTTVRRNKQELNSENLLTFYPRCIAGRGFPRRPHICIAPPGP